MLKVVLATVLPKVFVCLLFNCLRPQNSRLRSSAQALGLLMSATSSALWASICLAKCCLTSPQACYFMSYCQQMFFSYKKIWSWTVDWLLASLEPGFIRFTILTAILGDSKGADSLQVPWLQRLDYERYLGIALCQSLSGMCRCCQMLSVGFLSLWPMKIATVFNYIYISVCTVCLNTCVCFI